MATYTPEPVQGLELKYGNDTTTMTAVDNLTSLRIIAQNLGEIEWTHLTSTIENFIPTIVKKAGEIAFTYQWQATQYNALVALEGNTSKYWKIEFPDTNGYITLQGFLRDHEPQDMDDPDAIGFVNGVIRGVTVITLSAGTQGG